MWYSPSPPSPPSVKPHLSDSVISPHWSIFSSFIQSTNPKLYNYGVYNTNKPTYYKQKADVCGKVRNSCWLLNTESETYIPHKTWDLHPSQDLRPTCTSLTRSLSSATSRSRRSETCDILRVHQLYTTCGLVLGGGFGHLFVARLRHMRVIHVEYGPCLLLLK